MKVSIITVCHNQLQHTKRFVNSLKRYTPQEPIAWELIIIDSGSTDGTFETFQNEFKTVGLQENAGWIKGINEGMSWADSDSDILIFANNDIVLDSAGWLERLLKHFDSPTVGAVGPTSNYVMGRQNSNCNVPYAYEEESNFLVGFFFAVRREVVDAIGPLSEDLADYLPHASQETKDKLALGGADDLDYSIRIRQAGWRMIIARDVFVWHAGSRTFLNVVGPDGYNQQWRTADLALEKKWGKAEVAKLHEAPLNFAIGIPLRGWHPHWKFSRSFAFLQKPYKWNLLDSPRGIVDQSRNAIVQKALEIKASHLLFLDDDHIFPPDLFFRLMSHNKDVVGALGFRRVEPFSPCIFSWLTNEQNGNLMVRERPDWIKTGLRRVDAMGYGAVLIRMSVFERLGPPPWFKFDEVGEDLFFCDRCAQKGVEVWCDTDLIVPHINDEGMEASEETFFAHHQWKTKGKTA
ncbi:MAG TPA: glycosyltransferase family 2 protein [Terriglobia bacterium]|nr:glycosyltransferase family 2 protein [Terriglobia bacterium]